MKSYVGSQRLRTLAYSPRNNRPEEPPEEDDRTDEEIAAAEEWNEDMTLSRYLEDFDDNGRRYE